MSSVLVDETNGGIDTKSRFWRQKLESNRFKIVRTNKKNVTLVTIDVEIMEKWRLKTWR